MNNFKNDNKKHECWENIEIENNYGENVCINCGQVDRYEIVDEFIDFHENRHKIFRRSVYHRKYHICNTIGSIYSKDNIQITTIDKNMILEIIVKTNIQVDKITIQKYTNIKIKNNNSILWAIL